MIFFNSLLILSLNSIPAFAAEQLFNRTYLAETHPAGHGEFEQLVRTRIERAFGSYIAQDLRSEIEYGFTDKFQGSLYLNTGRVDAAGAPDDDDPQGETGFNKHAAYLQGFSLELIYRILSPVSDPIGLALYYEPELRFRNPENGLPYRNFENEYKILLQKDFLDDRLIVALNPIAEVEFFRYQGNLAAPNEAWQGELEAGFDLGASYRFAPNWYAGWEFHNMNELPNFKEHGHSVYFTGPAFHWSMRRLWLTLGALRQVYGVPSGPDEAGSSRGPGNLFLHNREKWETTFRLGIPF